VDVGHAFINRWRMEELFIALGDRLKALHLHDNDGRKDSHLPLGEGVIDWESIFAALRKAGSEPDIVLEYNIGTDLGKFAEGLKLVEALGAKR
jgi:sugar phosphate isomerase/epimerase